MQVDLACKILDGAPFREDPARTLTVQPARFEMRGDQFVAKKKPKKKPKKDASKVDKALGWGGFDDQLNPTKVLRPPELPNLHGQGAHAVHVHLNCSGWPPACGLAAGG